MSYSLDLCQNFISTLENKWVNFTKFGICIYIDSIDLDYYMLFFALFVTELWPLVV